MKRLKYRLLAWLLKDVTRVEVIGPAGREFSVWKVRLEHALYSLQDNGMTLKIFYRRGEISK